MTNFDWTCFTRKIAVKANMVDIYNAWTRSSDIEKWFLSKAVFYDQTHTIRASDRCIAAGDTYAWNWHLFPVTEYGKILRANGTDVVQFTFAGDCLVDIQLHMQDGNCIVTLTQSNIPTDEESMRSIRLGCDTGWCFYLVNLKSVFEGGLDLRNRDEYLPGMLNM